MKLLGIALATIFVLCSFAVQSYLLYRDVSSGDKTNFVLREQSGSVKTLALEIQHRLAAIERKVEKTERVVKKLKSSLQAPQQVVSQECDGQTQEGKHEAIPTSATSVGGIPQYKSFQAKEPIKINQDQNGLISVSNDDPSLTGKMVTVQAERLDGKSETLTLTIPPPIQ